MKDFKNADLIVEALNTYTQMSTIVKKESKENMACYDIDKLNLLSSYNVDIASLLAGFTAIIYQKGKDDAIKELKEKIG